MKAQENKFLHEIAYWFSLVKDPGLKEKISQAVEIVDNKGSLSENQKKLLGFICFSFSMNRGPASFIGVEILVKDIAGEPVEQLPIGRAKKQELFKPTEAKKSSLMALIRNQAKQSK